ncbi:MAG: S8 family serine peptidase [Verrucomicrobiota bacterium]
MKSVADRLFRAASQVTLLLSLLGLFLGSITAQAASPNLQPYTAVGWSDKMVVVTNSTFTTDSPTLLSSDTLYVKWVIENVGTAPSTSNFDIDLFLDGSFYASWTFQGQLNQNSGGITAQPLAVAPLSAGTHSFKLKVDADNTVAESNEADNEYTKTITIQPAPADIRVTPLSLSFGGVVSPSGLLTPQTLANSPAPADMSQEASAAAIPIDKLIEPATIAHALATESKVDVIVRLAAPHAIVGPHDLRVPGVVKALQPEIRRLQQEVLEGMPMDDLNLHFRFDNLAAFSGEVTEAGLLALQSDPRVAAIEPVRLLKPHLAQGIPAIHGMTYRSSYNGAGVSIAICDTGIDYNHPYLGGGGFPNSKVIGGEDLGDNDLDPIAHSNPHGTACAGIAAGNLGTVGDYIGGVAPSAKLYAVKISKAPSDDASTATIAHAWDWCVTHKNDDPNTPILVISTSFGGGRYASACDSNYSIMAAAANNAVAAGIAVLASSGNDGYCDAVSEPACLSSVIAVGGTYDAAVGTLTFCVDAASCITKNANAGCTSGYAVDESTALDAVTGYSNMSPLVRLLAPSSQCYTTDNVGASGYSSGDFVSGFGGTSAACPYAAGAVACLQSAAKALTGQYLSVSDVIARLTSTGDPLTDAKAALTKPRINLERAIESLQSESQTFRIYNDGPGVLAVNALTTAKNTPWIHFAPAGPFQIPAGFYQAVMVTADFTRAPQGETTNQVIVTSSDSDETPYPGGVAIVVNNTPPVISDIPDQNLTAGGFSLASSAIPFLINDSEIPASSLTLSAASTDTALVPLSNIVFGGSGTNRSVTVTPVANRSGNCYISVTVSDGANSANDIFMVQVDATVAGRYIFYNNSSFDGNNASANGADDGAIATDKTALLPGQTAAAANYTSFSKGITGIMVDIAGLPGSPAAVDFDLKVSNNQNPVTWSAAPAASQVLTRAGAGVNGASRVTLVWANNAIQNQWLKVTVKASAATGLASADVFYFGNAIGECTGNRAVNVQDVGLTRQAAGQSAAITSLFDFDRSGLINVIDIARTRGNAGFALVLLQAP